MGEPAQTSRTHDDRDPGRRHPRRGPLDVPAGDADAGETTRSGLRRLRYDVGDRPFLVLFELTRACNFEISLEAQNHGFFLFH